jgi:hypothetical protein
VTVSEEIKGQVSQALDAFKGVNDYTIKVREYALQLIVYYNGPAKPGHLFASLNAGAFSQSTRPKGWSLLVYQRERGGAA